MHTIQEKKQLLNRVRRLMGQLQSVERALEEERECTEVLHTIATCRGALNGLMIEVVAGQMREHVARGSSRDAAAEELLAALRSYLS